MNEYRFWEIINRNLKNPKQLIDEFSDINYSLDDVLEFSHLFWLQYEKLDHHKDFIIKIYRHFSNFISSDGFEYLKYNLIFRGQKLFNSIIIGDELNSIKIIKTNGFDKYQEEFWELLMDIYIAKLNGNLTEEELSEFHRINSENVEGYYCKCFEEFNKYLDLYKGEKNEKNNK